MGVGASTRSPADGLPPIGDYGLIPLFGRLVGGPEAGTFRLGPACRSC